MEQCGKKGGVNYHGKERMGTPASSSGTHMTHGHHVAKVEMHGHGHRHDGVHGGKSEMEGKPMMKSKMEDSHYDKA